MEDYDNYIKSFEHTIGQTFRVNELKTEPAEFFRRLHDVSIRPVAWCGSGAYYDGDLRLSLHPFYHAGLYYLQEPSAMAPAQFLPVMPGDKVLDLCAAPGGKSTALAAKLKGEGLLVSNDISISRCKALIKNIQMAGISNAIVTCESPERLAGPFAGYFDKILVDAPCSGEGMFRRDPAMVKNWSLSEVERYAKMQREILSHAAAMLKPGGCLMYSTCTYSPRENEQTVDFLLKEGDFTLLPLPEYEGVDCGHPEWSHSGSPSIGSCRRFWNHRIEGEGQFAALFKKKGSPEGQSSYPGAREKKTGHKTASLLRKEKPGAFGSGGKDPGEYGAFLKHLIKGQAGEILAEDLVSDLMDPPPGRLIQREERLFLVPENAPDLSGLRVVSSGLHIGNCKKKRFEPGQALAMALRAEQFENALKLSLPDIRIEKYLKCETIEAKEEEIKDGWCLVCAGEFPLGWGKARNGRIKNKYPAGWRKQ